MNSLFLEAESFSQRGGWVVDPAAMGEMGSAYLMAHGAGVPVADAETTIEIPEAGEYHIWARTRDWTAVWKRGTPAGRFTIRISGYELPQVLGTNGEKWAWQKAGSLRLSAGEHTVALHDLTGFNGRCDALYFSTDPMDVPPDGGRALEEFRKEKCAIVPVDDPGNYDLVVAGGGMAGSVTALAAARVGLHVLLLQDRAVLGGCNSSEIRVPLGGCTHVGLYPNLGNTVREIAPIYLTPGAKEGEWYEDVRKENAFRTDCAGKAELRLRERVVAIETDPEDPALIHAVIARNTVSGKETRFRGKLFSDCSGDGTVAHLAGARYLYGSEGKEVFDESLGAEETSNEVMGLSLLWTSTEEDHPVPFPDVDWGIRLSEETCYPVTAGDWENESGQYRNQAEEVEYIRDYSLMTTFVNWSFLKNHFSRKAEWAKRKISWVSPCGGKRESRRFLGDYVMTQNDIEKELPVDDGTASISWSIDLHYPEPENKRRFAEPFRSCAYHRSIPAFRPVPYRCLYSRDVKNLFLGGRLISLSHVAFSAARVMRTLGMLGEVVAMAAKVCMEQNALPRDVYTTHLEKLKEKMRAGIPTPEQFACPSVGRWESYHFKDLGYFHYDENRQCYNLPEETKSAIRILNREHLFEHTGK